MGKGLLYQMHITPGLDSVAVCDIRIDRCIACLEWLGRPYRVVRNGAEMEDAIRRGLVAVCEDGELLSTCAAVEVVVEASSSIIPAGRSAIAALRHGKHLVLMNAEIDLIFGPYLKRLAAANGVVCTSCDGDQYGVIKHLVDEVRSWGFDLVMAGNIKGFLDRYANPTTIAPEADKRRLDYKMCASYTDGTKLCIEMAITANAFGLITPVPGMHGPRAAHVRDVTNCFDFDALWRDRRPMVDYILGAEPGGGVFTVGYCANHYQREMLAYYKMGDGPFYLFYRPYHLCHIEAMQCIRDAAAGRPLLQPDYGFTTNVYAYAKRDLKGGDRLDGIGGYACYGLIENCMDNPDAPGLPICLAEDLALRRDVAKDEKILLADVDYDPSRLDFELFRRAQAESD